MGSLRIKRKGPPWKRVTNALVIEHASPTCLDCKGRGELVRFVDGMDRKRACPCCDPRFKDAYAGRLRRTAEGFLEYRALAATTVLDAVESGDTN